MVGGFVVGGFVVGGFVVGGFVVGGFVVGGVVAAVSVTDLVVAVPAPFAPMGMTTMVYWVPAASPVTVALVAVPGTVTVRTVLPERRASTR